MVFRMEYILDENRELPKDFLTELYKWALECKCYEFMIKPIFFYNNYA